MFPFSLLNENQGVMLIENTFIDEVGTLAKTP